ncbi:MAG TPA: GNAT family N-acetyltransferase [Candidatus Hydrogenedentes bacterium]|nr:GNAT family N-acetyltransferase [Candidatus Hydrogenedentota bacterium]
MEPMLHCFEHAGKRYAIDPETCFCFECDEVSWSVVQRYPHTPVNHILHQLRDMHPEKEINEVIGELEWLRASKSILTPSKHDEIPKLYEITSGLCRLSVQATPLSTSITQKPSKGWLTTRTRKTTSAPDTFGALTAAVDLLLGRAEKNIEIQFDLLNAEEVLGIPALSDWCEDALRKATRSGKKLQVNIWVNLPGGIEGHPASIILPLHENSDIAAALTTLRQHCGSLTKTAKIIKNSEEGLSPSIIIHPNRPDFQNAVEACEHAGFRIIELDIDGAYVDQPDLDPQAMLDALHKTAVYYAGRLLKHHYFRLDPIENLFWRIYNGTPRRRFDPAGIQTLAIDAGGIIYPSTYFFGQNTFRLGSVRDKGLNETLLRQFEDVGALTTPECMHCWARNLCGGGTAAVHQALSGSFRHPHEPWCRAQRQWMQNAIAAFSLLSSQGVNFTRIHGALGYQKSPSLATMLRAAFQLSIGMRAIEEADAEWLIQWENWNDAAYFTWNESGLLLATKYDREMDSLHPRNYEQEFVLTRKNGKPLGLLKVRPDRSPECAMLWIYLRREKEYASDSIRRSFRTLLHEAAKQQAFRRILTPVAPQENALAGFLTALGFELTGTLRQALYLHGTYHDVRLYSLSLSS